MLICKNDKIGVLTMIRKYVVNWYHTYLLNIGTNCTEDNISHHYYWHKLRYDIRTHIKVCKNCQKNNKQNFKYGKLSLKEAGGHSMG